MKYILYHYAYSPLIKITLYFLETWKTVQQENNLKKEGKETIKRERGRILASYSKESNKLLEWIISKPWISWLYLPEDLKKKDEEML